MAAPLRSERAVVTHRGYEKAENAAEAETHHAGEDRFPDAGFHAHLHLFRRERGSVSSRTRMLSWCRSRSKGRGR